MPRRNGCRFDHYTIEHLFGRCSNFLRFTVVSMEIWMNSTSIQRASDIKRNRDITNDIHQKHKEFGLGENFESFESHDLRL